MSKTYLFYDIETTGLNKAFDQILHFAAIRTDMQLNELNRYEIKIKLNPDVAPSPKAMLVHKISIENMQEGVSEYTAIQQIHQWLNEPGTISLGYNTLNFDDEFLRFSFYRNLLPPYTHQYANQCSRMDIYPMAVMYFLYKNDRLQWPERNGKTSFKLEDLNTLNRLAEGASHNALADVEMTIALAKIFHQEKEMWDYLQSGFNKQSEQKRIQDLTDKQAILVEGALGHDYHFQSLVYYLGLHQHYKNQSLWLRLDHIDIQTLPEKELIKSVWVKYKKLGEPGFVLPVKERFMQNLPENQLALAQKNKKWLLENPRLLESITQHHAHYLYPTYPETDPEASLYLIGFWSFQEENFCRHFHKINPEEKINLINQIENPILSTLAFRIVAKNFPDILSSSHKEQFSAYLASDAFDYRGEKKLSRKVALEEIAQIKMTNTLTLDEEKLLNGLESYLM